MRIVATPGRAHLAGVACALVACGGARDPRSLSSHGVDGLTVDVVETRDRGQVGYELRLRFAHRPPKVDDPERYAVTARVACQVGALRLVEHDNDYMLEPRRRGGGARPGHVTLTPFRRFPLTARPSLCEIAISESPRWPEASTDLVVACARPGQAPTEGRCPPNHVDPVSGGWSVPSITAEVLAADDTPPFHAPPRLILRYVVQSHQQQPDDALVETAIDCPRSGKDVQVHVDAGGLGPGESFAGEQLKIGGTMPPPDEPCTVTLGQSGANHPDDAPIEAFCYRERRFSPGACP